MVSNGHGATKIDLGEIGKSRGVPKHILKTSGTKKGSRGRRFETAIECLKEVLEGWNGPG